VNILKWIRQRMADKKNNSGKLGVNPGAEGEKWRRGKPTIRRRSKPRTLLAVRALEQAVLAAGRPVTTEPVAKILGCHRNNASSLLANAWAHRLVDKIETGGRSPLWCPACTDSADAPKPKDGSLDRFVQAAKEGLSRFHRYNSLWYLCHHKDLVALKEAVLFFEKVNNKKVGEINNE